MSVFATEIHSSLKHAHSVIRFMVAGIVPSAENASRATAALKHFADSEQGSEADIDLTEANTVLKAMRMGVAPSQEKCLAAASQVAAALEVVAEGGDVSVPRERQR